MTKVDMPLQSGTFEYSFNEKLSSSLPSPSVSVDVTHEASELSDTQ